MPKLPHQPRTPKEVDRAIRAHARERKTRRRLVDFDKDVIKLLKLPPDIAKELRHRRTITIRILKQKRKLLEAQGVHLAKLHRDEKGVWAPGYKERFKTIIRMRNGVGLDLKRIGGEAVSPSYDPY